MFKTNPRRNIFAVVGTVAILSVAGVYLYNRTILAKELTPQEAARIVPEEAWMVTHISSNSKSWSKLTEFGSNKAKNMLDQKLNNVTAQLSSNNIDIDYRQDIEPWLGNITIAKLPTKEGQATLDEENSNLLAIIGITNKFEAGMFLNKLQDGKDSNEFQKRTYKGITIVETPTQTNEPLNTALIGHRLIMASSPEIMNLTIDTIKGKSSFADRIEHLEIAKNYDSKNTLIKMFVPEYTKIVKNNLEFSPTARMAARRVERFNNIESMMMWVDVNDNGLHFRALAQLDSPANSSENIAQVEEDEVLALLPDDTIAFFNGQKIDRIWSYFIAKVAEDRILRYNVSKYKKSFETSTNLDLNRDVFSWMNGEFALALVPVKTRGMLANYGLAGMVIWETNERSRAENTLAKIENKRKYLRDISVEKQNVNGKEIIEWKNLQGENILSYTWLNDSSLILKLGAFSEETLEIEAGNSIVKNKTFTGATKYLPKENHGYLYINNLDKVIPALDRSLEDYTPYSIVPEARAALTSVEAIALTTSQPSPSTSQLDMFVSLKSQ